MKDPLLKSAKDEWWASVPRQEGSQIKRTRLVSDAFEAGWHAAIKASREYQDLVDESLGEELLWVMK